ncbi:MAG: hypothetical protein FWG18_01820 [Alphaproteobacteria bacterium]|nr:hypothetical protein [Alphaproteobacteria bacterium]
MFATPDILIAIKYIAAAAIVWGIWMFPAWIARQNKVSDQQMVRIRFTSWGLGWTGVGWLIGLWLAVKK